MRRIAVFIAHELTSDARHSIDVVGVSFHQHWLCRKINSDPPPFAKASADASHPLRMTL